MKVVMELSLFKCDDLACIPLSCPGSWAFLETSIYMSLVCNDYGSINDILCIAFSRFHLCMHFKIFIES